MEAIKFFLVLLYFYIFNALLRFLLFFWARNTHIFNLLTLLLTSRCLLWIWPIAVDAKCIFCMKCSSRVSNYSLRILYIPQDLLILGSLKSASKALFKQTEWLEITKSIIFWVCTCTCPCCWHTGNTKATIMSWGIWQYKY